MAQCPCCGKIFEGERGASIHLHYCPKRIDFIDHKNEQLRQRRKEGKDIVNSKIRWKVKI